MRLSITKLGLLSLVLSSLWPDIEELPSCSVHPIDMRHFFGDTSMFLQKQIEYIQ